MIGFIGFGQMNQMLAKGFLDAGALNPEQIVIATRSPEKVASLIQEYPKVRLVPGNDDLAELVDLIIIGVRPLDLLGVLREIHDIRGNEIHIVSIAACVQTDLISRIYHGQITRILPSICSTVGEGISLCYHHPSVGQREADYVEELFSSISTVKVVSEDLFEPAGDLMSCAPAILSQLFIEYAHAGSRHSSLSLEECFEMVVATAFGTALMLQDGISPEVLISRVATPGGITEEGVKIISQDLPMVFDRLFDTTLAKYDLVKEMITQRENDQDT